MQSPSKQMQQLQGTTTPIKQDDNKDQLPIWADPIKVKQNPTKFQYTKSYMKQSNIPNDSSLPLAKPCVFHFSQTNTSSFNKSEQYISAVKPLFECDSVWSFAARWRTLKEKYDKKPSQLLPNQNLFCFIKGIEPMWEDPVNKDGGRLVIIVNNSGNHLDDVFEWILCAFVGGGLHENGVVGIAVSKRHRGDRVELWLDQTANDDMIPVLKNKLCHLLASTCHDEIQSGRYKKHFK
ncbi:translation initiation factor eIF 4e-like domain-containing protein [Parasitella parasitica]|nr:translation initiation factor eIF 4e-like domain-containing protein [Parasitella parasitica]